MKPLKRIATINDISGFGKCSLTVSLPILSAAGIETAVMPTAILSTHTGGFTGYTYRDLTKDLESFSDHWKSLDLDFNAIYTGYLGSAEQIDIVSAIIDKLRQKDTLVIVDPVMADNGKLYTNFTKKMSENMFKLASKAAILIPNMTEASLILNRPYQEPPYTKEYIRDISEALSELGPENIILTGVSFDENKIGASCYNTEEGSLEFYFGDRIPGSYHGTGDIFASFLVAALLNDYSLANATGLAVELTYDCIVKTKDMGTPAHYGVAFELIIPKMIQKLNKTK